MTQCIKAKNSIYLPFLSMLLISFTILARIFKVKLVSSGHIEIFNFMCACEIILIDVIAEMYGYKMAMKFFWYQAFARIAFLSFCSVTIPSHVSILNLNSYNFNHFFQGIWLDFLINPTALYLAWSLNSKLLIKWKLVFQGRFFCLRSIVSSGLAEIIFQILLFFEIFFHSSNYNFSKEFIAIIPIIACRLVFIMILSYPALLIINILRITEKFEKNKINLNPFKLMT